MRRLGVVAFAVALLAFCAVAVARVPSSSTKAVLDQETPQSGEDSNVRAFVGHLESPRAKCLAGRTVKLVFHYSDGSVLLADADRTGRDGLWAVGGNIIGAASAHFVVPRKRVGHGDHRKVCRRDSYVLFFA